MSFDNVRRMAERGLMRAQQPPAKSAFVDMFQHILDEYEREAKEIHDAAIDEAVKAVNDMANSHKLATRECDDGCDFIVAWESTVDEIKELKE